ncbi:hypothetical protein IJ425_06020 [bacterium]|nr:hypothetical protein [bacterium]
MKKQEVKLNNLRTSFSKRIKRKILLEVAKGRNPNEVLLECAFLSLDDVTKDKKYAAKLLHKWRKELYENKEILNILNHDVNREMLDYEIEAMGCDDEYELIGID